MLEWDGAQERLTDLDVNPMIKGRPGGSGRDPKFGESVDSLQKNIFSRVDDAEADAVNAADDVMLPEHNEEENEKRHLISFGSRVNHRQSESQIQQQQTERRKEIRFLIY